MSSSQDSKVTLAQDPHVTRRTCQQIFMSSGLITHGNRIIVPREMRPEMLQYIHEGHQGKKRCLLRARNTIFWPRMTYNVQQRHRKVYDLPGVWEVSATHRHIPRTAPISMAYIGNRFVLLERNRLSDSCRCLLKVHHSEEIAKFHLCSHVHRTIYDCHRVRPTSHNQK